MISIYIFIHPKYSLFLIFIKILGNSIMTYVFSHLGSMSIIFLFLIALEEFFIFP